MRRNEILSILSRHQPDLKGLGVRSLALFGSTARDESGPDSDVDMLVEFDSPIGLFHFVRVQRLLGELLGGAEVDLVLRDAVLDELKEDVYGEAVNVL